MKKWLGEDGNIIDVCICKYLLKHSIDRVSKPLGTCHRSHSTSVRFGQSPFCVRTATNIGKKSKPLSADFSQKETKGLLNE